MYLPQIAGPHDWGPLDLSRMFLPWSITSKTTIVGDPFTAPSVDYFYNYIYYDSLLQDETLNFGKYLAPYNERYVIVHNDTAYPWEKEKVNTAIENLKNQDDLSFLGQNGYVYIFENEGYAPHIFIPSQNLIVSGGLDTLKGFNDIEAFDPNSTGLLYFDQGFSDKYPNVEGIVLNQRNGINDIALSQVADKYLIVPFNYTDRFYPRDVWSKVGLVNWYWFWGSNPYGPDPWDFDYGKGFVTNYDFRPVTESVSPRHIDTGNPGEWFTVTVSQNDHINISSDGQSLILDYTFDNENALSVYVQTWFGEENWESYDTRSLWVYGDGSGNTLDMLYFQTNVDGSQGWSGVRSYILDWVGWRELYATIPESLRSNVSQFMIALSWDLNKSQAGLGSHRIMVKDIVFKGEGEAVSSPRQRLDIPVKIDESGTYRLYARVLESPSGGELSVLIDGQEIASVNTEGRESNFVWKDLGSGVLNQGTIHITLENSIGLNAVNVLALIPEDVAQGYFDSARQFLEGKRTVHIWEGKLATPRIIETGHIAGQVSPYLIATGSTGSWGTTHNTDNEDINISSDGQSLVIDYTFIDESSLSAYAQTSFGAQNWTDYDILSVSVYGDGSGNSLNFWYHQTNPDGSESWQGIGFCTLNWTGWKELSFSLPQLPRDRVEHFMIALSWDLTKSQAGLGSHQIKVKDIKIAVSAWHAGGGPGYIDRLGSEDGSLVIDYTFDDESSLSVYAQTEFEPEDWTYRDTLSVSVYGDGSGNYLDFWYQQLNDDGSPSWYGMGACTINWTGWRELYHPIADWPRDSVKVFRITVAWDINKAQAGLGSHQIKVKDIVISIGAPEAATTSIDVLRDSEYRIGVLAPTGPGHQPITLKINNQELEIDLTGDEEGLKWAYSEPIFLYAGQHTLQLSGGMAVIDRLMLFSTNSEETLEDIFQANGSPASVISWEEKNAAKYVVHVDAQSPFMLAFAEAFNSHWVAKINGKEYKSQPLYAVINGFWIDETSELEITIEYKPQQWFNYGAIISVVSLFGALGFVVWDLSWKRHQRTRSGFRR
jgi:hypothetical protein